jgi:radical SAM protein with 4Fe4S-binding SPASM domain
MQFFNLEFTEEQIRQAAAAGRLLSMELELSRRCNFRCSYCYVPHESELRHELRLEEIKNVILQAKELGARKIILLGGEPSIYPDLEGIIGFLSDQGLEIEMFTNGSGVDDRLAALLARHRVRVVLKMNSRDGAVQDRLAGLPGAAKIIDKALSALRAAGYPAAERFLAVSTIICRQNIAELPALWRWLRGEGIEPYFEIITPQANALVNTWLEVDRTAIRELFFQLSDIDRREFGRTWDPQPPLVGNRCMRHQVSCLVTATGEVMPCVGVTISLGSIRRRPLADILQTSEVIANLKNFRQTIKGHCHDCDKAEICYGCRGAAYQLTGDYLAADPTCWRNGGSSQS